MKLTTAAIRSLTLPPGVADRTFFDDALPGFGLRLRAGGSRNYVVQYKIGATHRRLVLGSTAALEIGKARAAARNILAAVRLGQDPAGEKLQQRAQIAETFGALLPRYLAQQRDRLKPRSYQEVERHLLVHARPLHGRAVAQIDRRQIALRLGELIDKNGPGAAGGVRRSLSAYFSWLLREGLLDTNPVTHTNTFKIAARERVLNDVELAAIWRALGEDQYGAIVKLLMLTGARRDEVASLRWDEIDLEGALITLPPVRMKGKRLHEIPLAPKALEILRAQPRRDRELVFGYGVRGFQDWSGAKKDLEAQLAASGVVINNWRLHDLRRSISTTMHERLGVMPHIVEAVLAHSDGHLRGVAGVYNKSRYLDQKRRALEKWADHIEEIVSGRRAGTVVELRGHRS
jgi:integrase